MYEDDVKEKYGKADFGNKVGYGRKPAILVVDFQVGFTDPEKSPLASKIDTQIDATNTIIDVARTKNVPILFTVIAYEDEKLADAGLWFLKSPNAKLFRKGGGLDTLDIRLHSLPSDMIIVKKFASAFFGTCLLSVLIFWGVDTLIVTGCTTSGCVRATIVDGLQYSFRMIVPAEAVGDRASGPHEASLYDIDSKYGDVVALHDIVNYLNDLSRQTC